MDNTSGVGVLDKAAIVLSALEAGPSTLAQLVTATGLARPTAHRLAVMCGDGRAARELRIVNDARDAYVGQIDGWCSQTQRLENLHEFAGV